MPVQHTYGTAGATGGGFASIKGLQAMFVESRLDVMPAWSWQRQSAKTWRDRNRFVSLWSWGCRVGGGDLEGYGEADIGTGNGYEPFSCDGEGTQSRRFIRGVTRDSVGAILANAIVQGFVTSTDAYVGEVLSNIDGTFTLGTETLPGVQHYLVAYKAGGGDVAGSSVNTITSTHVDGS